MAKKIKILFVQESLTLAGGEKSLIALLSNIDPDKYEIDLQLFRFGGELEPFVPEYVNILPPLTYTIFAGKSLKRNLIDTLKGKYPGYLFSKLKYSVLLRTGKFNHPEKAQLYWQSVKKSFEISAKEYDVAIAYAQGVPTFYTMDKIKAKKKVAWVNVNVKFPSKNKSFNYIYYKKYDKIVTVSDSTIEHLMKLFPDLNSKFTTIYDIIDYNSIVKMSNIKKVSFSKEVFNILTVARLNLFQKGYDITLEACKILKDEGIEFHWYALGKGEYREEMEKFIEENDLKNHFTFLGTTPNPYPYFKAADLYVQTSRHEGYGLSIAEARLLNIPIVTTRFDSVDIQMIHKKNGLITDLNGQSVAEGIIRMMEDKELYHSIRENLKKEPKENLESIEKFDRMIEML